MSFLSRRRKRKQLSELIARRHAEDDLLSPALRLQFDRIIDRLRDAPEPEIDAAIERSRREVAALLPRRRGMMYAVLDLVAVVGAVAFGLRGVFFQPFRIPTGSMQPTLFGIHYQSREGNANPLFGKLPGILGSVVFGGVKASAVNGGAEAAVLRVEEISGDWVGTSELVTDRGSFRLPGNPRQVADYAGLRHRAYFAPHERICDGMVTLGDHLFVERVSLYLVPPRRGDVIVFNTEGLAVDGVPLAEAGGYYYIKRLAALPGDTVKIVDDQLYLRPAGEAEFRRIQEIEPKFGKVYSMRGGYHGHLGGMGSMTFSTEGRAYTIPEDHYLMLGDNSRFSMDSRYFGAVPRRNLVGRAWFVFYPLSRRVGRVDKLPPLDEATGESGEATFPVMSKQ